MNFGWTLKVCQTKILIHIYFSTRLTQTNMHRLADTMCRCERRCKSADSLSRSALANAQHTLSTPIDWRQSVKIWNELIDWWNSTQLRTFFFIYFNVFVVGKISTHFGSSAGWTQQDIQSRITLKWKNKNCSVGENENFFSYAIQHDRRLVVLFYSQLFDLNITENKNRN